MDELNEERKYCVYCHINKINNKSYIGVTGTSVQKRWGSNGGNYKQHKHFWNAIRKYGWDNFEHIILFDQLTKVEAFKIERLLIAIFNTQNPNLGYNMSPGGEGGNGGIEMTDEIKRKISNSLKGRRAWNKGIDMSSRKPKTESSSLSVKKRGSREKKVNQYDLNGVFIRTWNSMSEASRALNIYYSCIGDCCIGRQKTAGGFMWRYFTEDGVDGVKNIIV